MCEKRELEVFFDVAGVEWVCQLEYNPISYPMNYAPRIRLISVEACLLDRNCGTKELNPKEMDELWQTFGDKIEKLADDEYAEALTAERNKEWQAKLEDEEYQLSKYNDGLREEQMLGRV
ncbi:MAG: hypothetical protein ACI351_06070 [Candidatus Avelusimicrobium sp.]|uniref:hypothetical protein n=1 Tax=Candidatus Avelusimicrobium sp. TaxID=3048833 RepID=UPI003F117738